MTRCGPGARVLPIKAALVGGLMATLVLLTAAQTQRPVVVNLDGVTRIRQEGGLSHVIFGTSNDAIDVTETLAQIIEKWREARAS